MTFRLTPVSSRPLTVIVPVADESTSPSSTSAPPSPLLIALVAALAQLTPFAWAHMSARPKRSAWSLMSCSLMMFDEVCTVIELVCINLASASIRSIGIALPAKLSALDRIL